MEKSLASSLSGDKMIDLKDIAKVHFIYDQVSTNSLERLTIKGLDGSDEQSAIEAIFSSGRWTGDQQEYLRTLFSAFINKAGFEINDSGILFPGDVESWEEQKGVKLFTPVGEIELTEDAFDFIARAYFRAVYSELLKSNDKQLRSEWGQEFANYVKNAP